MIEVYKSFLERNLILAFLFSVNFKVYTSGLVLSGCVNKILIIFAFYWTNHCNSSVLQQTVIVGESNEG